MQTAMRLQTTVLPGGRIEVTAPELPEGDQVELIILVAEHTVAGVPAPSSRYPVVLEMEYNDLIEKKLSGTLAPTDELRLQAVRDEITAIDQNYPDVRAMNRQKLTAELAAIRAELEALPLSNGSLQ